jgi:Rieske Fe-S protein
MPDNDAVETPNAASRRTVLRGALLAGMATPLLGACGGGGDNGSNADSTTQAGSSKAAGAGGSGGDASGGAKALTETSAIPEGSGKIFDDAGVVITQPQPGEFKGFTNICTHMGCPVHDVTSTINCTCHGSKYSITDGSVVNGPATQALAAKQLKVAGKDISLA